jgi:adenylate cyclase
MLHLAGGLFLREERRRLAAILAADVAGYSRLMAGDEAGTLARLKRLRAEVIEPGIARFHGRVVGSAGDSLLVEFVSAVNAVQCAIEVQRELRDQNANLPEDRRMAFRMGVNLGDVIAEDGTIHGDAVNVAARLEKLAEPGGICVGRAIYDQVKGKLVCAYDDLGEQRVHNIPEPVRAYRVKPAKASADRSPGSPAKDALALPDRPSIAVLPFVNMSGDPDQEYFADGISEDIISALLRFHSLDVTGRNSSFAYKGRSVDLKQVSRELGAQYILEGSVRKAGNRVRITAQLIHGTTDRHIWAEKYDRELEDVFQVQDEITKMIVGTLVHKVDTEETERRTRTPRADKDAYDCYLVGREFFFARTKASNDKSLELMEEAIALDPGFARAYAFKGGITLAALGLNPPAGWAVTLR